MSKELNISMRLLYKEFQISETPSHLLSWLLQYAMHNISSRLFVCKYQFYLPNREELQTLIEKQLSADNE